MFLDSGHRETVSYHSSTQNLHLSLYNNSNNSPILLTSASLHFPLTARFVSFSVPDVKEFNMEQKTWTVCGFSRVFTMKTWPKKRRQNPGYPEMLKSNRTHREKRRRVLDRLCCGSSSSSDMNRATETWTRPVSSLTFSSDQIISSFE